MAELATLIIQILQLIWSWVYFFSPIKATVIDRGSRGCRLTFGIWPTDLEPGLRFGTMFQTLHRAKAKHISSIVTSVRFNLSDGSPVRLDAMFIYNIDSYSKFMLNASDSNYIISEYANAEIKNIVSRKVAEDMNGEHGMIDAEIMASVQERCNVSDLGVSLFSCRLTDAVILNAQLQTAMCLQTVVDKMADVMNVEVTDLFESVGVGSAVALVTGNIMNTLSIPPDEDETTETMDEDE